MRYAILGLSAAVLTAAAGCIPSQPLAEGEMDRYWTLTDTPAAEAPTTAPAAAPAGGFRVPARWVIRQRKSLIWSTISILRAVDKLKTAPAEVEFSVSPDHAEALVDILAQAREALADLEDMLETSGRADRNRWAETLAGALVKIESISRLVATDGEQPEPSEDAGEPLGMAAEPMLEMIAAYLDDRAGGGLLGELTPAEFQRLRDVLTQVVLKLGFDVAGREPPDGLRETVSEQMRSAVDLDALREALGALLSRQISRARAAAGGESRKAVQTVLKWAPKAFLMFESFLGQWDRMESITVDLIRRGERRAVAVTLRVLPGRQIRIDDVMFMMPAIVFRGATRIVVLPDATDAGEAVVSFDPVGDGAVELRFEGLLYGLARLLAFPLASGPLREVRVFAKTASQGRQIVHVAVLTEAEGDRQDPRRMLVVQDTRTKTLLRRAFSVESVAGRTETLVTYVTPQRRYTYRRLKTPR